MQDLQRIYDELQTRQAELNAYYDLLDKDKGHEKAEKLIKFFLTMLNLPRDDESYMAGLTRLVSLREDALEQVMKKNGFDEKKDTEEKEVAFGFVHDFHTQRHEALIQWIEQEQLLTPFYRSLIYGVHYVGVYMTMWQGDWTRHILHSVNLQLSEMFNGDDAKVFEMLQSESLLDTDESGCVGDRCYSVLHKEDDEYKSVAYAEAFPQHVKNVTGALSKLIKRLEIEVDDVFNQKEEWIAYFQAIQEAFEHTVPDELIGKWAEVDRKWMAVKTPLQVGHPLEYYEDHYRKSVALEWDLRIVNPAYKKVLQPETTLKTLLL